MVVNPLADARNSGVYYLPNSQFPHVQAHAKASCRRMLRADLSHCANITSALKELGRALNFPEWYGANFDALNDCLTDEDWQSAEGQVVHIAGLQQLRQEDPQACATLIEVFQAAGEQCREFGLAFWILLDTPATGVDRFPAA